MSSFSKVHSKNHPKVLCLREVFKPLYLILSLLGLFPSSIQLHNTSARFRIIQKSVFLNALCSIFYIMLICSFLVLHLRHIYFSLEASTMTEAIMTQMNYITELVNLINFSFVAYICTYLYRNKYVDILEKLALRVDPPNFNSTQALKAIGLEIHKAIACLVVTTVMQTCVNFTRKDSLWKKILVAFSFNLPQIIQFTVLACFYVFMTIVARILANIREHAGLYAREKRVKIYGLTNVGPKTNQLTLRQMEMVYVDAFETKQMINRVFEGPILVTMIQCFHTIVSESHIIYHGVVVAADMDLHSIVNCSIWIVYQLLKIFTVVRAGSVLKMEILKLNRAVHNIPTDKYELRFLLDVQHFSSTMASYGNELTVYGLFPLDSTLLFKIVASASMYIIILVQFDKTK